MDQDERLDRLLRGFCEDSLDYKNLKVEKEERRNALRALMNLRMPGPLPEKLLQLQDEFLREEAREKGIVTPEQIPSVKEQYGVFGRLAERISVWQGDITRLAADAVVNAANSGMLGCFVPCHRCIDNAIHSAAGVQLRQECFELMEKKRKLYGADYEEPTGGAEITLAYNLPANYVIHTVGPVVHGSLSRSLEQDLRNCYQSCLKCASAHNIKSLAFCCISTGEFHFPNERAAEIAVKTTAAYLEEHAEIEKVIFNVYKDCDLELYQSVIEQRI